MSRGRIWMKATGVAALAAVASVFVLGCKSSRSEDDDWPDKPGPKVVVSFAPLYCFAANVAGDDATVRNVMTTTGPHDFNPTDRDARRLSRADVLFIVGMGLDDHPADLMRKGSGNDRLQVVPVSKDIPKKMLCESQCRHEHKPGEKHDHGDDPHVWLGPDHAVVMVNTIRDTLKEKDPAHAAGYDQRAAAYVARLAALKEYGLEKFKGKKDNRLVTFHDSLAYFAQTYGLEIRDVLTQKPGQEPDAKEMKRLIRICADENKPTRVIAGEPQYSNSTSGATLQKELAAKGVKNPVLVEIDTLETVRPDDLTLTWYEERMRKNIDALAAALE